MFNPLGLTSAGQVLQPRIIIASDIVTLNSLDRRTGAVIAQQQLTRNVDYVIDYPTGMLRFLNVPLPFDANYNPQVVLVQYEYEGVGTGATTAGGHLRLGTDRLHLNVGYVNQSSSGYDFTLFSQSIGGQVYGFNWDLSHAATTGGLGVLGAYGDSGDTGNGNAVRASISAGHDRGRFNAFYESTTGGYSNPFGALVTPGLTNYRIAYDHPTGMRGSLTVEYDGQTTNALGVAAAQQNAGIHLRQPLSKKVTLTAGVDLHTSSGQSGAVPPPSSAIRALPGSRPRRPINPSCRTSPMPAARARKRVWASTGNRARSSSCRRRASKTSAASRTRRSRAKRTRNSPITWATRAACSCASCGPTFRR